MVISTLARGGCERQVLATAHGLVQRGYRVEIFELSRAPVDQFSFRDELSRLGLTSRSAGEAVTSCRGEQRSGDVYGLRRFAPLIPHLGIESLAAALHGAIVDFRPDVVHCWSELANVIGGFVAAKLGVPRIVLGQRNMTPYRQDLPQADLYREAFRELLSNANVVMISNSAVNRDEYDEWLDLPGGTIKLLYNGFLPSSLRIRGADEVAEARRSLGVPDGARTIGTVMRLAAEKDPDLWVRTALIIARLRADACFVLAGYGELSQHVAARIREFGLAHRVKLTGPTRDVGLIYAALDVFLMTSRFEGTPNTLIEAQAAGVPIVAPLVGGTAEAALDGMTAILVRNRRPENLARAVLDVLHDPGWRERSASLGPAFVSDRFSHRRMVDETIATYGHART